jgi:hypothetical protein
MKRIALLALLFVLLAAPTPGAVGSCGTGSELQAPAELETYCKDREELICVRRYLRKELSIDDRDDCRREVIDLCERRFWAPECRPTRRQANACLNALRAKETVDIPEDELDECDAKALCTATLQPDAGEL